MYIRTPWMHAVGDKRSQEYMQLCYVLFCTERDNNIISACTPLPAKQTEEHDFVKQCSSHNNLRSHCAIPFMFSSKA